MNEHGRNNNSALEPKALEALSAYIDGEAGAGDAAENAVGRALQRDPALLQRQLDYERLGRALRDLPAPEVGPAFTQRVLAATEATPRESAGWGWRLRPAIALGAAALVVVAGSWYWSTVARPAARVAESVARFDTDEAAIAALSAWVEQGGDAADLSGGGLFADAAYDAESVSLTTDELLLALAEEEHLQEGQAAWDDWAPVVAPEL